MKQKPVSRKGVYPFSLACPSFIYPAGYAENARRLAGLVDEIELLFFESAPENLPDPDEIELLKKISDTFAITYNVHLPIDISIAAADTAHGRRAESAIIAAYDRARPLSPVSWTLHVPLDPADGGAPSRQWVDRACGRIERTIFCRNIPARAIALETLDYPPFWLHEIVERTGCSICLDTGHLMVKGIDCKAVFDTFRDRITIVHSHGVSKGRDHLSLESLSPLQQEDLLYIIRDFSGTLSIEVFDAAHLFSSLDCLDRLWHTL